MPQQKKIVTLFKKYCYFKDLTEVKPTKVEFRTTAVNGDHAK